jgi:hypothetical protein
VYLENVVFDALDPQSLGRFWEATLGTETLTDEPEGYETRLAVPGGPVLDLCFQRVPEPPRGPQRLRLRVRGDAERHEEHDPQGNAYSTTSEGAVDGGPLAAVALEVADPAREQEFWGWLTGWVPGEDGPHSLRHPSLRGPLLELVPEEAPKGSGKNRIHLDVRLETGEDPDAIGAAIAQRGGHELQVDWGELPWRSYADPSGNEFCVLPVSGQPLT